VLDHQVAEVRPAPGEGALSDAELKRHGLAYGDEYLGLPGRRSGRWVLRFSPEAVGIGLIVDHVGEAAETQLPAGAGEPAGGGQAGGKPERHAEPFPGFFDTPAGRYPLVNMEALCLRFPGAGAGEAGARREALFDALFHEKGSRTAVAAQSSQKAARRERRSAHRARRSKKRRYTVRHITEQVGFRVGLFLTVLVAASMFGILYFEAELNAAFTGLWDTLWYSIVTITTVGYGDKTPLTVGGKIVGLLLMGMGVIVMAAVTGRIASFLVEQQLRKREGLLKLKNLQNHFIICGWRRELEKVIEGVLARNPQFDISDIVLINNVGAEQMQPILQNPAYRGIGYINGDYIEEETLQRARIRQAARILILADFGRDYSMQEVDSRTVMAVLTIESLTKRIYVCAELLDAKFEKYLQLANCDEIILSREYSKLILAGASTASGVSQVLMDLLDTAGGRGLETRDIPGWLVGQPFGKLCDYFSATYGSIAIGLMENTGNFYQRKREALNEAQMTPDISTLVQNLRSVKELVANKPVLNPGREYTVKKNSRAIVVALAPPETAGRQGGGAGFEEAAHAE
jgi:voltage-gated potassium channel